MLLLRTLLIKLPALLYRHLPPQLVPLNSSLLIQCRSKIAKPLRALTTLGAKSELSEDQHCRKEAVKETAISTTSLRRPRLS